MRDIPLIGGGTINLRPLTLADRPALSAGVAELSSRSTYLRYHSPRSAQLTKAETAYLINVDQIERAAWVLSDAGKGIAVGRYFKVSGVDHTAELSLAILDPWQNLGFSKLLLAALMRTAQTSNIVNLVGTIINENIGALRVCISIGVTPIWRRDDRLCHIKIPTNIDLLAQTTTANAIRYYHQLL